MKPLNNSVSLWAASPSQFINAGYFGAMAIATGLAIAAAVLINQAIPPRSILGAALPFGFALVPIIMALWRYANIRAIRYTLVDQRIFVATGVLNRVTQQIELFRVRDFVLEEPLTLRLLGLSNVMVLSADIETPFTRFHAVRNGAAVVAMLRTEVMNMRQTYGVREVEVGSS